MSWTNRALKKVVREVIAVTNRGANRHQAGVRKPSYVIVGPRPSDLGVATAGEKISKPSRLDRHFKTVSPRLCAAFDHR